MAEWLSDGVTVLLGRLEPLYTSSCTPELPYGSHLTDWRMDIATKEGKVVIQAGRRMGDLLKLLLTSERRDDCVCSCFLGGCTPAFMMLKRLHDPHFDDHRKTALWWRELNDREKHVLNLLCERRPREVVRAISSFLAGNPAHVQWAQSMIRFETFTQLQLRHTCCWFSHYGVDVRPNLEDVRDAREEDGESLAVLESLIEEFEAKFLELQKDDYDVVDFLNGYHAMRMGEVLSEPPVDPDTVRKIEEIGVVLNKDSVDHNEHSRSQRRSWPRYRFWERPGTPRWVAQHYEQE
ncbi:MAG: hypothetical protein Q9165_008038 [Trypethelium subeluteriae]